MLTTINLKTYVILLLLTMIIVPYQGCSLSRLTFDNSTESGQSDRKGGGVASGDPNKVQVTIDPFDPQIDINIGPVRSLSLCTSEIVLRYTALSESAPIEAIHDEVARTLTYSSEQQLIVVDSGLVVSYLDIPKGEYESISLVLDGSVCGMAATVSNDSGEISTVSPAVFTLMVSHFDFQNSDYKGEIRLSLQDYVEPLQLVTNTTELQETINPYIITRSIGPDLISAVDSSARGLVMNTQGSRVIFSGALVPQVGIGDALQYDSDQDGQVDSLVFIAERLNDREFRVQDAHGRSVDLSGISMSVSEWQVFRAYTSIAEAERGEENIGVDSSLRNFDTWLSGVDLVSENKKWQLALYGDGEDVTPVEFNGWVTDSHRNIKVFSPYAPNEVGISQRHQGVWSDIHARINVYGPTAVRVRVNHIHFEGLLIRLTDPEEWSKNVDLISNLTDSDQAVIRFNGNYVDDVGIESGMGASLFVYGQISDTARVYLYNNIFNSRRYFAVEIGGGQAVVYNNTIVNRSNNPYTYAMGCFGNSTAWVKNNIGYRLSGTYCFCDDRPHLMASEYSNNLCNRGVSGGNNNLSGEPNFNSIADGDLKLSPSDNVAFAAGTDLTNDPLLQVSRDILNQLRPNPPTIGAHER